jgi:predicted ArsR family transcriptional regulator
MASAMGAIDMSAGGESEGGSMPNGAIPKSFRTALHAVADALTAHGFAAHAERHKGGLQIVSDHCPFGGTAIEHPVICAVDRGLVRGMLGALYGESATATSQSRPMGDDRCITSVSN